MNINKELRRGEWLTAMRPLELAVFLKWLLRVQRIEHECQGLHLWLDPASNFGRRVIKEGIYEQDTTLAIRGLLGPGETFIDIGANEGWFSVLGATLVGPRGRVLTCEPQERLWPVILKNIGLNGLANVQLLPYAVSKSHGAGVINLYPSVNTGSSHIGGRRRRWETAQRMRTVPLEALLESVERPAIDLVKIDVEGFEHEVLLGAGEHLGSTIRRLIVEIHPGPLKRLGSSEGEVRALLAARGYQTVSCHGVEVWQLP